MHFIVSVLIVLLAFVIIGMVVVLYYVRKGLRFFKRISTGAMAGEERQQQTSQQGRTTRTADGVTIVDRRNPDDIEKKIFSKDEGEYVDFTE